MLCTNRSDLCLSIFLIKLANFSSLCGEWDLKNPPQPHAFTSLFLQSSNNPFYKGGCSNKVYSEYMLRMNQIMITKIYSFIAFVE